jgi:hypothetical protein
MALNEIRTHKEHLMEKRYSVSINAILALTVMVLCFSPTPAKGQTFDLRQLSSVQDGKPAFANERIKQGVQFLQQELANPSDPSWGVGGGPIDTGYVQSAILGTLKFPGAQAPSSLREQWKEATDPRLKDLLAIPLAALGAEEALPTVIRLARNDKDGSIRLTAIIALRAFLSPPRESDVPQRVFLTRRLDAKTGQTLVDVLAAGLQDPFKRYRGTVKDDNMAYYPAQEQANLGLKKMGMRVSQSAKTLQIRDANGVVIRSIAIKPKSINASGR